jgi:hypothetical protein
MYLSQIAELKTQNTELKTDKNQRDATIERLMLENCNLKEKLAAETARNQAQLNGFVSMALHQHQQPVYTPPPQPTQIYAPPPPPIVAAPPPPAPLTIAVAPAKEPNIQMEIVSAKPATEEKIPRPKQYLDELKPIDINYFTEAFKNDEDYDEQTQEGYRYLTEDDLKTTYEGGRYDSDRHEYWLLDIIERLINGYGEPLTYRSFHSIRDTKLNGYVMAFYENKEWIFDNELFESKFITCLRNMRTVINNRISDIEVPALAQRNAYNAGFNIKKDKDSDEILVETVWESEYTQLLRGISAEILDTITHPYKIMTEVKKKFILDTDTIIKDIHDPTRKLNVNLEKK